jgi:pimeloyl-ACP methyl ester carboxylesterase
MGARVALEVVRMAPERVAALALVSTGTHPVGPGEAEKRYALRDTGREQGMAALVADWLPPMIAPDNRPALLAPLAAMCEEQSLAAYEAQIAAMLSRPALEDLLPTLAMPVLSCTGALDVWSPPAQASDIAGSIPGATLEIVAEAGHFMPIERPEAFNAILARWLHQIA